MNDGSWLEVLDDISFNVEQNEMVGIIGHSGCGKTTLLRCICAFEGLNEGCVLVDGVKRQAPGKDVLMLFQDFNQLLPWKTVIGNVVHPLLATRTIKSRDEARNRARKMIADVGLSDFESTYPHQLSGGMKQRAAVARALALHPRVLLMDEPFAALDNITRGTLQTLTRQVCEKYGITVLFVTHSVEEAVIMADRIIIMDRNPGRIKKVVDNSGRADHTPQERGEFVAEVMELLGSAEV
jgi:NitT/TauT family transport system ATP-binding protein